MTDEELRQLIAENAKGIKELRKAQLLTDEKLSKIGELIIATNAQLTKTDAQLAKTDAQLAKTDAQLAKTDAQLAKTDAQLAKTDIRINKLSKRVRELSEMYGGVSGHLGDEAELDFFAALNSNPQLDNIHFDDVDFDLIRKKDNEKVQIDLFLFNKNSVGIIEVKRHLQSKHLDDLYNRIIPRFIRLFPEHRDKTLYAGLATYAIPKRAKPYVEKRIDKYGFALLTPNRDHTAINIDAHAMRAISV
jgi:hypothetical protein